jgi:hypothetical protein
VDRGERHDPLPGLVQLPGFLWRKLGRIGQVLVGLLAVAGVAAIVLSIPSVNERRRNNEQRELREDAAALRQRLAYERAVVRPRRADGVRSAVALERAIGADVLRREHRRPLRVRCESIGSGRRFSCLAVTSEAGSSRGNRAIQIGFPYRAVVDARSGRAVFCRALGQPGEGSLTKRNSVSLPAACAG